MNPFRRPWHGALWNVSDQATNSLGNVLLSVVVASQVSAKAFGTYAIVIGIYLLALSVEQALVGEALLVLGRERRSNAAPTHERAAAAAMQVGLAGALALSVASMLVSRSLAGPMLALAVLLPALMLQDALRFVAFSQQIAREALINDVIWTIAQVGLTVAVLLIRPNNVALLIGAWAIGAALAACIAYRRLGLGRLAWGDASWFGETRYLGSRYLVESLSTVGAFQVAVWLTGGIVGVDAAGGLRLAQVIFGPVHVVFNGWRSYLTPRFVRSLKDGTPIAPLMRRSAVVLLAISALVAGSLWALPTTSATELFGQTWLLTRPLLWLVFAQKALEAIALAPFAYLRAAKRIRLTVSVRFVAAVLIIAATALATPVMGVRGAAAALIAGSAVTCCSWWGALYRPSWVSTSWLPGYRQIRRGSRLLCVRWRHRQPRPGDLFIVSYPKSGNTWLRFVLADAYGGEEPDFDSVEAMAPRVGEHHRAPAILGDGGRLIKSHEPRHGFFATMPGRHIYIVRDGRDVAVSYYYHMLRRGLIESDFTGFLERFLTGEVDNYGRWSDHVSSWLEAAAAQPDRIVVIQYEQLLDDAVAVTRTALEALTCPISPLLDESFERNTSDRMRGKESASKLLGREEVRRINFVRSARAGDWTTHFSETDHELFWRHAGDAMRAAGYAKDLLPDDAPSSGSGTAAQRRSISTSS